MLLNIIQFFHILIDVFNCSYIFLFNPIYDFYFASWILFQTIHWIILKNECILSSIEKRIMNPNYVLGSQPKFIPHNDVYHNKITLKLKAIILIGTLLYISFRTRKQHIKLISLTAIFLWIYMTYFY